MSVTSQSNALGASFDVTVPFSGPPSVAVNARVRGWRVNNTVTVRVESVTTATTVAATIWQCANGTVPTSFLPQDGGDRTQTVKVINGGAVADGIVRIVGSLGRIEMGTLNASLGIGAVALGSQSTMPTWDFTYFV